jgi:hypothetical protein
MPKFTEGTIPASAMIRVCFVCDLLAYRPFNLTLNNKYLADLFPLEFERVDSGMHVAWKVERFSGGSKKTSLCFLNVVREN